MIPHSKPTIGAQETEAVDAVLHTGRLSQGPEVEAFEAECAAVCGRKHGVAVNSGTAALHLALAAVGAGEDDAVAIPSYVCAALTTAIRLQGARPVPCEIGDDYNLEPKAVPAGTPYAIYAHLFGAKAATPETDACLIEDIAQSFGGDCGDGGKVSVTSFYATKLITTGEGGMLLTDDDSIAEYARDRRDYDNRDDDIQRYAYKMTDFQAAMGRAQLRRLAFFLDRREELADRYWRGLRDLPLRLPDPENDVFFRYVIATSKRDALQAYLLKKGVEAKRPVFRPAHHYLGGEFPVAERAHAECLSLPIYPSLVDADADLVIELTRRFFDFES